MFSSWVDWVGVGEGQPEATGDLDRVRSARPATVGGVGPLAAVCLSDTPLSLPQHPPWEEVPCPVPKEGGGPRSLCIDISHSESSMGRLSLLRDVGWLLLNRLCSSVWTHG